MGNCHFDILGVDHELRLAGLVGPGSVLSIHHAFTPLTLTTGQWHGAWDYSCSQIGKLGFRELRYLAALSLALSPPCLGVGIWPKSGFLESLWCVSVEACREHCPSAPIVAGAGHAIRPPTQRRPVLRPHTKISRGATTCWYHGSLNPAVPLLGASQFCELFSQSSVS